MNIFFRDLGEGIPIVLIHGFCETNEIWDGFDKKLSSYGRIISIDLPGFGKSPLPAKPVTIHSIAEILISWLKERHIANPVLVGHSLGGYVALAMAEMDPEICSKLVLFHSSIYADSEEKKNNRDKVVDFVIKNGVAPFIQTFVPSLFYNKNHPDIEKIRTICIRTNQNTLIEYTRAMRDRPSRENFFKDFSGSTLVLAGSQDEIIPIGISEKMAAISSKSTFFALPESGHIGMVESQALAVEKIGNFIVTG